MSGGPPHLVLCNGAQLPAELAKRSTDDPLRLEYREAARDARNVKVSLPDFVRNVFHLPDRILDLLEIAAYVFAADRRLSRGTKDAVEYQAWARSLHFVIKVRDHQFWQTPAARQKLAAALRFMSGDREYDFTFHPGHSTPQTSLFDSQEFEVEPQANNSVVLFSGGLDSLAGIVERLETTEEHICLISHRSQPGMVRTQDRLFQALQARYPTRLSHYKFQCHLKDIRAREETQRTRGFLYTTIAYALCHALSTTKTFFVYENGMTSINFPKRQDMGNARSSRTTHPQTIALLQDFFSEIEGARVTVATPFLWKTKTEVFQALDRCGRTDLITSSVSCSKTFQNLEQATHCGSCSQCVDRRFAAYAAGVHDIDEGGIYAHDFIGEQVDGEAKTILLDYVRQAKELATSSIDHFADQKLDELAETVDYVLEPDEVKAVECIFDLCQRHGKQVLGATWRMREAHESLTSRILKGSFLDLVNAREYLKEPVQRLVTDMCERLSTAIPVACQRERPRNENHFNDIVSAVLNTDTDRFEREHPYVPFALGQTVPDHSRDGNRLYVESKYIRTSTTPSKASEAMAADLTKYPSETHILFVVYDPDRSIVADDRFSSDFEDKGRCTVCIIR